MLNEKSTITADCNDANYVYAVWDRLSAPSSATIDPDGVIGLGYSGPAMFSRTTNGGISWEPARSIYSPADAARRAIGNQIVVPPAREGRQFSQFLQRGLAGLRNSDGSTRLEFSLSYISSNDRGVELDFKRPSPARAEIQSLAQSRSFGTVLPDTADDPGPRLAVENRGARRVPNCST